MISNKEKLIDMIDNWEGEVMRQAIEDVSDFALGYFNKSSNHELTDGDFDELEKIGAETEKNGGIVFMTALLNFKTMVEATKKR